MLRKVEEMSFVGCNDWRVIAEQCIEDMNSGGRRTYRGSFDKCDGSICRYPSGKGGETIRLWSRGRIKSLKRSRLGPLRIPAVIVALSARHVASNLFCGAPADAT